ncbi:MAG: 30S ribosomal protein S14 [Candidatus Woesearchaeota archaeon]|nr:MAG: 30S ribosomal protein S14 [Candidatus Woesearchaeota archaeon]
MTTAHHSKILVQIGHKKGKFKKYQKHNTPRTRKFGRNTKCCTSCGRTGAHISKYGLHYCRQCFRDKAKELGFKMYD